MGLFDSFISRVKKSIEDIRTLIIRSVPRRAEAQRQVKQKRVRRVRRVAKRETRQQPVSFIKSISKPIRNTINFFKSIVSKTARGRRRPAKRQIREVSAMTREEAIVKRELKKMRPAREMKKAMPAPAKRLKRKAVSRMRVRKEPEVYKQYESEKYKTAGGTVLYYAELYYRISKTYQTATTPIFPNQIQLEEFIRSEQERIESEGGVIIAINVKEIYEEYDKERDTYTRNERENIQVDEGAIADEDEYRKFVLSRKRYYLSQQGIPPEQVELTEEDLNDKEALKTYLKNKEAREYNVKFRKERELIRRKKRGEIVGELGKYMEEEAAQRESEELRGNERENQPTG